MPDPAAPRPARPRPRAPDPARREPDRPDQPDPPRREPDRPDQPDPARPDPVPRPSPGPVQPRGGIDYRWHLAESGIELEFTELEFALMRSYEAFGHWQSECLASVVDLAASGPENALLHIIRMNDRPKSVKELARLTNRDDVANIHYSLRKLIGAGLVARRGAGRAGVTYAVTEEGRRVTDAYGALRRRLLIAALAAIPDLGPRLAEATRVLNLLGGLYEEVARVAATHRRP